MLDRFINFLIRCGICYELTTDAEDPPYHKWFPRMCEYGFTEGKDYLNLDKNVWVQTEGSSDSISSAWKK